jgi:hypothetical protein
MAPKHSGKRDPLAREIIETRLDKVRDVTDLSLEGKLPEELAVH